MSDEVVKQYQEQLEALIASIGRKLDSANSLPHTDIKGFQQLAQDAEADIYDGKQTLTRLEAEVRGLPYNIRSKLASGISSVKQRFEQQQYRLIQLRDIQGAKAANMSRADEANWRDQRQRLLGAKNVVDETSASLDRTTRSLMETTEIGVATTIQLQQQREALLRSQDNLKQTDDFLSKSKRALTRMRRRLMTNKLIQAFIILLELGILGLIIYLKYYR